MIFLSLYYTSSNYTSSQVPSRSLVAPLQHGALVVQNEPVCTIRSGHWLNPPFGACRIFRLMAPLAPQRDIVARCEPPARHRDAAGTLSRLGLAHPGMSQRLEGGNEQLCGCGAEERRGVVFLAPNRVVNNPEQPRRTASSLSWDNRIPLPS